MTDSRASRTMRGAVTMIVVSLLLVLSAATVSAARDHKPPTTPTNLRVTATTAGSVSFAWNPSTDDSGRFYYVIQEPSLYRQAINQTKTSFTWTSLTPGRTYTFSMYAEDYSFNQSGTSNSVSATTPPDVTPPLAPTLSVTVLSPSQVSLSWTRSTDDVSPFVTYRVLLNGNPHNEHLNWYGETGLRIRHLTPSTTYTVTVQAVDGSGNKSTSNAVTVTTQASSDVTPPSAPTNVHIEFDQGCGEIWLGWTQSTDDLDPQSAIEYEIYVNGVLSPLAVSAGVDRDFVYATAQGHNTFVVKAVDRTGNTSADSNAASTDAWPC